MINRYKNVILTVILTILATISVQAIFCGKYIKPLSKMYYVLRLIDEEFYYSVDKEKIFDYALTGMTLACEDTYTNYYSAENFNRYKENSENNYIGIGIVITGNLETDRLKVISVMENSPGEAAGIKANDIILKVEDKEVFAGDLLYVSNQLKGTAENVGNEVSITILRNSAEMKICVAKDFVEKDTVQSRMLSDKTGYIRISSFDRSNNENMKDTYDEFAEETEALINKGMEKLVLDLRDNPGGDVGVVSKIADYILPKGVITYTEDKYGKRKYIYSDEKYIDMEIVVLINKKSASASEFLTCALKDYGVAKTVGEKSFGKGIVQSVYYLNDGSGLSLTTSKYFSPKGNSIHGIGIEPDYTIELSEDTPISLLSYENDTQLQKAIEILEN